MITEKNHKLLTSQIVLTDCTKKGLASMLLYGGVGAKSAVRIIYVRVEQHVCQDNMDVGLEQSGHQ